MEAPMFELRKDVVDDIIFAMEDQDGAWRVNLETGELLAREAACGDLDPLALPQPESVDIPEWHPRDGFRLMESFTSELREPSAKKALHAILSQGRGVFRGFKECLAAYPAIEKSFRERKLRIMSQAIREWYDEVRVAGGLERLGETPEEVGDLVESDLGFATGLPSIALEFFAPLIEALGAEIEEEVPLALAARGLHQLRLELDREDWIGLWVEDGEGGAIAGAAGRLEGPPEARMARIFFVSVLSDFRRMGIARSLVDRLAGELASDESASDYNLPILVDLALPAPGLEKGLFSSGFENFGARAWRRGS
jgi:hypothetical protein